MPEIVDYRPSWPQAFEQIAAEIRRALGPLACEVEHIGSTAVPGLCAKDVIDIQVAVHTLDAPIEAAMRQGGFVLHTAAGHDHVPPGLPATADEWAKQLFKNPPGARRAHIHVRRRGALNHRYALLGRDFLRAEPATAAAYGELKRRLAARLADPADYPLVKDPAVDLVHFAAERWARDTGWQPAPR